ncbi:cysteine desulfurase family protein [Phycisphaerales bacterium AB-hyl4]|uniref:Cysteine desulfurase family protein n=1 Tax=Natronomicrosphaera hydrolytica TaxID=3242702 RepID=A0ABV4U0N3_9BACT
MQWVYLDNNATTRPAPQVLDAIAEAHDQLWANPSSVHRFGQAVRQRLELARASVAKLIAAKPREIIFTSGGTEANNLALWGVLDRDDDTPPALITTTIEHSAVREPGEAMAQTGIVVEQVAVGRTGVVDATAVIDAARQHVDAGRVVLVSVQWANNETGTIQPVAAIGEGLQALRSGRRNAVTFHIDATQAVGKLPVDVHAVGADLLTLAAHKFHGPKGVGALYARRGVRLRPQQRGGPQEGERRGGTENTVGVIGMGVAADLARAFVADAEQVAALTALRDRFERELLAAVPGAVVNAGEPGVSRLWNTSNIAFPGLEAEAILLGLSEKGVCASAGAACSSGSLDPSPVLLAMGVPEPLAHGSVRFSISRATTAQEIDAAVQAVPEVVRRLGRTLPTGV